MNVDDALISGMYSTLSRTKTSANGWVRDYDIVPNVSESEVERWLHDDDNLIECLFNKFSSFLIKARLVLRAWFVKEDPVTGFVERRMLFYISSHSASLIHNFQAWYTSHSTAIMSNLNNFTNRASSFYLDRIEALEVKFSLLENQDGQGYFKLPDELRRKNAVINIDSNTACFKYALLSILHYDDIKKDRQRISKYLKWNNELDFSGVDINNVNIAKDIPKIEERNDIKINVHVWDKGLQGCRYNRNSAKGKRTVNLLLVVNGDGDRHYCGIPSLSRLYQHTKSAHNMYHMCERCCRSFKTQDHLTEHFQWCSQGRLQMERMPKDKHFTYTSFEKELRPLKVIYADIECYIQDTVHKPAAIASYTVWHPHLSNKQQNTKLNIWQGENSIIPFLQDLETQAIQQHYRDNRLTRQAMLLTTEQEREFNSCSTCPRCNTLFDDNKHKKVRDHCHITGKYRSPLCSKCNFRLRLKRRTLPVIFHNFKCYDAHIIIKHGIGSMKDWKLEVIPQTKEKYMSLRADIPVDKTKEGKTVYFSILFLDSYQFLSSSLSSLVNNLDDLPLTRSIKDRFPNVLDSTIRRKGVFPYSYLDSLERLKETALPPRDAFRNDLSGEECSADDYAFAQLAWSQFACRSFGDYLIAYLSLDVYLLADVFERFRLVSLQQDGLDPVHFISLPGLSFQSAFKMTKEHIDLLQDPEMYSLFERGIRGGMTFVNKHHIQSTVNTEDSTRTHLAYIDENNLYGSSMCKPLPHSEFSWVEDLNILTPEFIMNIDDEGEWGYTLEVDLTYPTHIHHKTADLPLAPESSEVTKDMFSPFMHSFYHTLQQNKKFKSCRKLLLTHLDKSHYVLHFSVLKFYLSMGMQLLTIHRAIKYKQKRWLKPYIDFNSSQRAKAQNNFEKDYYKLKNNSLFGKTMEDVRKRITYKLVSDETRLKKLIGSPYFNSRDIISDDIVGVHMLKNKVILDKPVFVGQAVLDYSKLEMFNLYYNILPQCPLIKHISLVGGDTDSFFLSITTDINITLSDVFNSLSQHIDTSNYPPSHPLYSTRNKARLGCFKDETAGQELSEMILLRPKMYSMQYKDSDTNIKRAKGITKSIVRNLKHTAFKEAYEQKKETQVQMTILRSKQHTIQTTTFRKRALSAWEDKRVWLNENESLPHGHVDSPVPAPKRRRVDLPVSGDVV